MSTEAVEEIVPEVVQTVVKTDPYLLAGVALASISAGAALGYMVASKRLKTKYELIASEEIQEAKKFYSVLHKKDEYDTPESAVKALIPEEELMADAAEALHNYQGHSASVEKTVKVHEDDNSVEVEAVVHSNIFVNNQPLKADDWDYEAEESKRSEDFPFVIHHDEFYQNPDDYEQVTVTYYEGDEVLADETDGIINDVEGAIGEESVTKFGHGSKDPNIVYVRNNKRGLLFEVVRSRGKYSVEVMGFDDEDDDRTTIRKFRGGYE